jgi:hypothetical protein
MRMIENEFSELFVLILVKMTHQFEK